MSAGARVGGVVGATIVAVAVLPPLGAWLAGRELGQFFGFPPPLEIPDYPAFSWWMAGSVGAALVALVAPWFARRRKPAGAPRKLPPEAVRAFPWWGWVAVAWTAAWWALAWNRFEWFAWAQRYTFTPLWLGFILAVNAATWRRTGGCLLTREPARVGRLFAASAAFWWGFEYLNRFVRNWHYLGVEGVGAVEYAAHASVCFSTVLPAVASAQEWLASWRALGRRLAAGPAWRWLEWRGCGAGLVVLAVAGLGLTGAFPLVTYSALWLAPLLLAVGLMLGRGADGWWRGLAAGDWREAGTWMLAALACGFFWELWNLHSLAKWIYTVPWAQRWLVFEMPLLGYAGYLPFGLECALAARVARGQREGRVRVESESGGKQ